MVGTVAFLAYTVWVVTKTAGYAATFRAGTTRARGLVVGYSIDNHEAGNLCSLLLRINGKEAEYELNRELYTKVRQSIPELPNYEDVIGMRVDRLSRAYPASVQVYPGWTMLYSVEVEKAARA